MVSDLTIDLFPDFFRELHECDPYPWQQRLAEQVIQHDWPGAIDLPTGSGKTACIDIAIFAMACQASLPVEQLTAPRRIFFCVNRRVIVDEAHTRARHIAKLIWQAEQSGTHDKPTLEKVCKALRIVGGTGDDHAVPPLDVLELRGGIYHDSRWARSITQPTIICTTLDQLGSRLLFRGYGVTSNAAPIQAALIAYDSLILLDEAHISEPFRQTLEFVRQYLDPTKWAEQAIGVQPVRVVPMTATPNEEMRRRGVIQLDAADRATESLNKRLSANKPAELRKVNKVIDEAVKAAIVMATAQPAAVGIIVNRIATARGIYNKLREQQQESNEKKRKLSADAVIELVIGSMRPIDRDAQAMRLRELVGSDRPELTQKTCFVVSTQCLEVGADYDFDALITECASLDALRQRFGRLNRRGRRIDTNAVIFANEQDIKAEDKLKDDKPSDPIYGNALVRTWNWLWEYFSRPGIDDKRNKPVEQRRIDFGINAFDKLLEEHGEDGHPPKNLLAPSASLNAPVMMPAYIDFWCQTAPKPVPDPDVALFIHGSEGGEPDVQVCWRADLLEDDRMTRKQWPDVVALLPPTSAECVSLPISRLRHWLTDQIDKTQDYGDVLGVKEADEGNDDNNDFHKPLLQHAGVLWRGVKNTKLIALPDDLRPGDTLVLPASALGSQKLGHLSDADHGKTTATAESHTQQVALVCDVAESAFTRARDLAVLRLHPSMRSRLPEGEAFDALFAAADKSEEPSTRKEWPMLLQAAANAMPEDKDELCKNLKSLAVGIRIEPYPDKCGVVLTGRRRLNTSTSWFIRAMDEGDDESSRINLDAPVMLTDHTRHVRDAVDETLAHLPLAPFTEPLKSAAQGHDLGKVDERFQAMLRRTNRTDAWLFAGATSAVLAKSDGVPTTRVQRKAACERAGLPGGFRHEMLSSQLVGRLDLFKDNPENRALALHLIAAHHGHARPFAPVVLDDELPAIEFDGIALSHEERKQLVPPHRLDSGIAERFWLLTRRFGWWGLAYLEAVIRLADQRASAAENAGKYDEERSDEVAEVSR